MVYVHQLTVQTSSEAERVKQTQEKSKKSDEKSQIIQTITNTTNLLLSLHHVVLNANTPALASNGPVGNCSLKNESLLACGHVVNSITS